jgi:trans-aconitate 2-methyltransferase
LAEYEFNGEKYLKASKHQKEWGNQIINELNIKKDDYILDLGCGDGLLASRMKNIAGEGYVLGIDASEGMISKANEYRGANLEFRVLNINDMDFQNMFSIIFSNATLHWVKNHNILLKNCYLALKKDGKIRFNFAGDGNCSTFYKVVKSIMNAEKYSSFFDNFEWPWFMPGIKDYENIIKNSNFKKFDVWEENKDRYFSDEEELVKWIDQPAIVPFIKSLHNEKIKQEFRNEVVEEMIKLTKTEDGKCFETFRRINVYAEK